MSMGPQDASKAYLDIVGIIDRLPAIQRAELFDLLSLRLFGAPGVAASVDVEQVTEPAVSLSPLELWEYRREYRTRINPEGRSGTDDPFARLYKHKPTEEHILDFPYHVLNKPTDTDPTVHRPGLVEARQWGIAQIRPCRTGEKFKDPRFSVRD